MSIVGYVDIIGRLRPIPRLLLILAVCCGAVSVHGQAPDSVRIRLVDSIGKPLSKAQVTIETPRGDISFTADDGGGITIPRIPPGRYRIRVQTPESGLLVTDVDVRTREDGRVVIDGQDAITRIPETGRGGRGGAPPLPPPPPAGRGGMEGALPPLSPSSPKIRTFTEPLWNVWQERYGPKITFEPLPKLLTNQAYSLVIDLSAMSYSNALGVYTRQANNSFDDWLKRNTQDEAPLEVLAIPDDRYFQPQRDSERVKQLVVNVGAIRRLRGRSGFLLDTPAFDALKLQPNAAFSFGRVSFRLQTRRQTGMGAFALSFWVNGGPDDEARGEFPIDELSIPICIVDNAQDSCPASQPIEYSLRGPGSLRAATQRQKSGIYPDAALHVVELDSRTLYGVFRCNTCTDWKKDEFHTWRIPDTSAELSQYLSATIISAFESAAFAKDPDSFRYVGEALYRKLFVQGSGAEARFRAFVKENASRTDPPASIFVRLLPQNPKPLFMVPLGLLAVPDTNGQSRFLGLDFVLESPLQNQDYASTTSCISNWVFLVPPDDSSQIEMHDAREQFGDSIDAFKAWKGHGEVYEDIRAFATWLAPPTPLPVDTPSTALVVVSHHDNNKLFFDKEYENPFILSVNINRTFAPPSVAIINACGTAKPGAYDFVSELNQRGISAIVATSTEVNSVMSGHFMRLLIETLREHAAYSLSRAVFEAIRSLSKIPAESPYGARALIYSVIGNGSLTLCPASLSGQ